MPLSALELLPPELLTPIFIYSSYSLPLISSSPLIAQKLSHKSLYHPTLTQHLLTTTDSTPNAAAHTQLFAAKWMTWPFFQSWLLTSMATTSCLCGLTRAKGCPEPIWPPDFEDATRMFFSRSHLPRLAFVRGRIPAKMLRGPWTDENVRFLRFVLWTTGMSVDWADPGAREAALAGRRRAMLGGNLEAVEMFNHVRRLGRVADLETLRFAVLDAGCDVSVVYDVLAAGCMRGSPEWCTWECEVLDIWCEERIGEGDPRGMWLKMKLADMRREGGPRVTLETTPEEIAAGDVGVIRLANPVWCMPITQLGWYYQPSAHSPRMGLHNTTRFEQGNFWRWNKGIRRVIRAHGGWTGRVIMDMWIPSKEVDYTENSSSDEDSE